MPLTRAHCPHCFATVFVNSDSICPACQGNVEEKCAEGELTPVEFVDGEKLPPFCLVCAGPSTCYIEVGERNDTRRHDRTQIVSRIMGAIGGILSFKTGPDPYIKEFKISVGVPICDLHRDSKALQPLYTDHKRHRLTLPACAEFIKRWKSSGAARSHSSQGIS